MTYAEHHAHDHSHVAQGGGAKDPVCGMTVDPKTTAHHAVHDGTTHDFCSASCRTKFVADPDRYLVPAAPAPLEPATGTIWTCPMHPEIRQDHPGSCPICGMALEPLTVTAESGPSPELADMTRRFWIGLALAYETDWPTTFWITALSSAIYLLTVLHLPAALHEAT